MLLFELMPWLNVNFHKKLLVGVNLANSLLEESSNVLHCKIDKASFKYLGHPIDGNA